MNKLRLTVFFIFLFTVSVASAQSQEADEHIDSSIRFMPDSDVSAMPGQVALTESYLEYNRLVKIGGKLPVTFVVGANHIAIENSTPVELPAKLTNLNFDIETTLPFFGFENMYQRIGINPSFYGDSWDFDSSDFRIPFRYYLIKIPNDKLTLVAGISIYPDFESVVLPILGFIYRPNDRLTFYIVPKKPEISYMLNDKLTLFGEVTGAINNEFEVDKDDRKNVILRVKQTRLGTGVRYFFKDYAKASLSCGALFYRSLKYRDSLGKVVPDNGFYTELRIQLGF